MKYKLEEILKEVKALKQEVAELRTQVSFFQNPTYVTPNAFVSGTIGVVSTDPSAVTHINCPYCGDIHALSGTTPVICGEYNIAPKDTIR